MHPQKLLLALSCRVSCIPPQSTVLKIVLCRVGTSKFSQRIQMATQGNRSSLRAPHSVHIEAKVDIEKAGRGLPMERSNHRYEIIGSRRTFVVERVELEQSHPGPSGCIEMMELEREPTRCNRPLAITIAGFVLFSTAGMACVLLRFFEKI